MSAIPVGSKRAPPSGTIRRISLVFTIYTVYTVAESGIKEWAISYRHYTAVEI